MDRRQWPIFGEYPHRDASRQLLHGFIGGLTETDG